MSLRDSLVPLTELANTLADKFGISRFRVILRRRIWSGDEIGKGSVVNEDIEITPSPDVSFKSPFAMQLAGVLQSGGSVRDRYYSVENIPPAFVRADGSQGGYTPQQLRMRVPQGVKNVDPIVVLIGDDGAARVCTQAILEDGDPFAYSMILQERDKDSVPLESIAVTPSPVALSAAAPTQQLTATGTYADGEQYSITSLTRWTSSNQAIVTVDLLGKLTRVAAGTAQVTASVGRKDAPPITVTVT